MSDETPPDRGPTTSATDAVTPVPPEVAPVASGPDPDRHGTFLIADIYPPDLGPRPNFSALVGRKVMGKEFVGCVLKAGEGMGWGSKNDAWFRENWGRMKTTGGDRYGVDWFRGAYYFLRLSIDGAKQADVFVDALDAAGGLDDGDLMPWVDVEEGGQGNWAGGEKLESIKDGLKRARLRAEVTKCVTAFIARFRERTGKRIAVYGRGIFRDLQMTNCDFGQDSTVNPAYTKTMPSMAKYGIPTERISLWQACGDGECYLPGFPGGNIEGWGAEDWSVYVDGSNKTTLKSLRERCLAKKP